MNVEQIREAMRSRPFRPFTIRMADQRAFTITHPDFLMIVPGERTVIVGNLNGTASILDTLLMTEIEVSAPTGA